jgi:HlyD family secretion protein
MSATPPRISQDAVAGLRIDPDRKRPGRSGTMLVIPAVLVAMAALAALWNSTRNAPNVLPGDELPSGGTELAQVAPASPRSSGAAKPAASAGATREDILVQTSGYIVPRERIELSPRFLATVASIRVGKGDAVKAGDILVTLESDEYEARVAQSRARVATAQAMLDLAKAGLREEEIERARWRVAIAEAELANAQSNLIRRRELHAMESASDEQLENAQRAFDVATGNLNVARKELALAEKGTRAEEIRRLEAEVAAANADLKAAEVYLDWCTIRAPVDGTILTRDVDAGELVTPQSFGGGRGPSTSFLSMADLGDLQVQIDLNEQFTSKVRIDQECEVSPLAYPDKVYTGYVFEIAPEANRSKGTLEVKVQIIGPDKFLTPELSAQVRFLDRQYGNAAADRTRRVRRTE